MRSMSSASEMPDVTFIRMCQTLPWSMGPVNRRHTSPCQTIGLSRPARSKEVSSPMTIWMPNNTTQVAIRLQVRHSAESGWLCTQKT